MINRLNGIFPPHRLATWNTAIVLFANGLMLLALVNASLRSPPSFDEGAHFASGVILAQYSDAGYFKVNPPVNKWITAWSTFLSMDLVVPPVVSSSSIPNSNRPEFIVGDSLLKQNWDSSFLRSLVIARLARVPFFLLGSWMLWQLTAIWPTTRRILCQLFWCTSPLMLGHGWIVSADALSGVAMCFVLCCTVALWQNPTSSRFAISGLAWGLAIGTKFTFGPLYLAYPLAVHLCAPKGWTSAIVRRSKSTEKDVPVRISRRLLCAGRYWFVHAAVACLVVNALYLFHETAMPIEKHDFVSTMFRSLTKPVETDWLAVKKCKSLITMIPSPFPRPFLEGVDQQMADMDRPRGAYIFGSRIPGEIHWFHLVGYAMKEQIALLLAAMIGLVCVALRSLGNRRKKSERLKGRNIQCDLTLRTPCQLDPPGGAAKPPSTEQIDRSLRFFCAFFLLIFGMFMTCQSNLVWNVRYLIPALPMIYLLVSFSVPSFAFQFAIRGQTKTIELSLVLIIAVAFAEFFSHFPHHFSYINPLCGGSYRVPIALNDSNFDYGQDLFYARDWVKRHRAMSNDLDSTRVFGVLSGHGCYWLNEMVEPASIEILQNAIRVRKDITNNNFVVKSNGELKGDVLIVSRGLFRPEPWAVQYSMLGDKRLHPEEIRLTQELLSHPPDIWISPVVVAYRIDGEADKRHEK